MGSRLVSMSIFDPSRSVFKSLARARSRCTTVTCELDKCPLRDVGTCACLSALGFRRCPYGGCNVEEGPTKRARGLGKWLEARRKAGPDLPSLKYPAEKMALVGEYVFLPYAFMNMNEGIPFLSRSSIFVSGNTFIPRSSWTVDTVLNIIGFVPRAYITNGEIRDYQEKVVPKFLAHLRECDPAMWGELVKVRPELDVKPNHVGRKAVLSTLNFPIEWTTPGSSNGEYKVKWRWDGERMRTAGMHAYNSTWGAVKMESVDISGVPAKDTGIKVEDNSWVNEKTVFLD